MLTKAYPIENMFDPFNNYDFKWKAVSGSSIDWAPGKDVTVEVIKPKKKGRGGKARTEPRESFFQFFETEDVDEEEVAGLNPMEARQYQAAVQRDFAMGCAFKDSVIPFAQKFYVGDPTGMDSDFEDEEEEGDGDWLPGMMMGDGEEGEGMPMAMLQALMGGGMPPEMMAAMAGGDSDEEGEGALFAAKSKSAVHEELESDEEEDGDDEEAAAAIRAAISGAFGQDGAPSGLLNTEGEPAGGGDQPQDCKQQ